ncbi:ATP-binding protein [Micromonospora sp. NBC_01655]|uniref:ATP-binding protein n=1 Tax=unclassified Micromonospora TaxID=2617518 RepID=UPI000E44A989|nr:MULTISPECIES: ATP-binding protein [unclassified Micromonospora]MCX4471977.1 ATP-binding protein [Micromonospora sp. NBC_01655]
MSSGGGDGGGSATGASRAGTGVTLLVETIAGGQVTALRHTVAAAAGAAGLADMALEDFVLAVHELVTNVVRHGGGSGELRLRRRGDLLTCEITDGGPGLVDVRVALPAPNQVGQRGLWLAQQLTDGLEIRADGQGTTVRVSARLATPATGGR